MKNDFLNEIGDKLEYNYGGESTQKIKKPIYKNELFWILIFLLVSAVIISFGIKKENKEKSEKAIVSISLNSTGSDIDVDMSDLFYENEKISADIVQGYASYEEIKDLVEFVVEDDTLIKIEHMTFSEQTNGDIEVCCEFSGAKNGQTVAYFQSKDGMVKSESINITIKGIDEDKQCFDSLKDGSLLTAVNKVNELGYTAVYIHSITDIDFTEEITFYDDSELEKWLVVDIKELDTEKKTVKLMINSIENIERLKEQENIEKTLSEKLEEIYAWQAVEQRGKEEYPYGFELNYIRKKLASEARDENTWFLKSYVTITNVYGAEYETICEATVTGTNENPEITYFYIY